MKTRSKKGSVIDIIGILVAFAFLIFMFIAIGIAHKETADGFDVARVALQDENFNVSSQPIIDNAQKYPVFWDFLIAFLFFGMWLASFISGFILGNNPIFIVLFIIIAIPLFFLGLAFETVLQEFVTSNVIATYATSYPITLFIIDHLLLFTVFFIVTVLGALYVKTTRSEG